MRRGLAGDGAAYALFLRDLAALLRSFLRKRLSSMPDEVEDLVQEVLIAIHNQRHTYDVAQPVTAWAHAIAKYKLIDFFRRNSRRGEQVELDDAEDFLATSDHDAQDAKRDVSTLLAELPPKQRAAIESVKIEGLSIAEASKRTGQSESLVKVNIHRGLKTLAARMRESL
ncbi:MAG: sigma-70 family RNA polymerase sigma factor [Burkholderiales bacterium]|nr:MAG: sigma-70 family RNA polymerase sigma factor [Burkholderiales bacterium]TAG79791.1 MAG: sigma-70 family RNA polymerase sigma factor [Betaproteobacteria bacterium]